MFGFRLRSVAQRSLEVARIGPWFDDYLRAFALCGRGDSDDVETLLEYYGVPLLLTTDEEVVALTSREAVLDVARKQVAGLRAANYDRSETLDAETTSLNATTAMHAAGFTRLRADGTEIARIRVTYLITDGRDGRRISAIVLRTL
jgi:hypothetical protein